MAGNNYFHVIYHCPSLHPTDGGQRVMSAKTEADALLVAEIRKLLADTFRRAPDEIEIVGIRGLSDPTQIWPPIAAAEISQGEGAPVNSPPAATQPQDPPAASIITAPAWTPADPPLAELPTIEQTNSFNKQQMLELGATLKLDLETLNTMKYPDLRIAVLSALQAKLGGQSAA